MKLLAGNSNRPLAEAIARSLGTPLTQAQVKRFADNEARVTIDENVRGEDVFIIQSTSYPANDNLMELLVCIDALKRRQQRFHTLSFDAGLIHETGVGVDELLRLGTRRALGHVLQQFIHVLRGEVTQNRAGAVTAAVGRDFRGC